MAFDPIDRWDFDAEQRIEQAIALSLDTDRVLEVAIASLKEEGDSAPTDSVEGASSMTTDDSDLTMTTIHSNTNGQKQTDHETLQEERKRLRNAIGGLLIAYFCLSTVSDGFPIYAFLRCYTHSHLPNVTLQTVAPIAIGVSTMFSLFGGIIADTLCGRPTMMIISSGTRTMGRFPCLLYTSCTYSISLLSPHPHF